MKNHRIYSGGLLKEIFPNGLELLTNTNQLWEIEMARGELEALKTRQKLIERSAFFARVDGNETFHYRICKASPLQVDKASSIRRQTFFDVNQFKTGYATHGLFPYRGKFHPQLVKAILNIIGLEKGETVLDPMAGSGTLCIEASVNGINSIGVDVSPFCSLMTRAKALALNVNMEEFRSSFTSCMDEVGPINSMQHPLFSGRASPRKATGLAQQVKYEEILVLCQLDAMGYAARRVNKTASELLPVVAERYLAAIEQFQIVRETLRLELGHVDVRTGSALNLDIQDSSIDGIVTSPPYSFAIDYAENDRPQLEYLGYNTDELKNSMVGLVGGKSVAARVQHYFKDMRTIFAEMARVLKPQKHCVVVIGSNEIQTGGIRHEVEFAKFGREVGFDLVWQMTRPIEGIRNSMRDEYVMFFQKE